MVASLSSPAHVTDYEIAMNPAVAAIKHQSPKTTGLVDSPDNSSASLALAMLISVNKNLTTLNQETLRLTPEEAALVLDKIGEYEDVLPIAQSIVDGANDNDNALATEIRTLASLLIELFNCLRITSSDDVVDEDSEGYQRFLVALMTEEPGTNEISGSGRAALFALLED